MNLATICENKFSSNSGKKHLCVCKSRGLVRGQVEGFGAGAQSTWERAVRALHCALLQSRAQQNIAIAVYTSLHYLCNGMVFSAAKYHWTQHSVASALAPRWNVEWIQGSAKFGAVQRWRVQNTQLSGGAPWNASFAKEFLHSLHLNALRLWLVRLCEANFLGKDYSGREGKAKQIGAAHASAAFLKVDQDDLESGLLGLPRPSSTLTSGPLPRQRLEYQAINNCRHGHVKMSDMTMNRFWEKKMSRCVAMCRMNGGDGTWTQIAYDPLGEIGGSCRQNILEK